MNEELIDKYLNQSLNPEEEQEFLALLQDEAFGRFLVKYCVEVHGYHSTAAKMLEEDLEKNKSQWVDLEKNKSGKWSLVALVAAAALLAFCVTLFMPLEKASLASSKSLQTERSGKKILAADFLAGDRINAEENLLTFTDGSEILLSGSIKIDELGKNKVIVLESGSADFIVSRQKGLFKVKSAEALIEVIGTAFSVYTGNGETNVSVEEGAVKISAKNQSIVLHKGERALVKKGKIFAQLHDTLPDSSVHLKDESLMFHMDFDGSDPLSKSGLSGTALLKKGHFTDGMLEGSKALQNGMIEISASNKDRFKVPMTVNAWVKVNKETFYGPVITKGDSSWRLQLSENGMNCHGGFGFTERDEFFNSERPLKKGMWQMLTLVYTDKLALMYVDGKIEQKKATELMHLNNEQPVQIGGNSEMPERFFDGLIDEVSIFSRALSEEEVLLMYRRMIK